MKCLRKYKWVKMRRDIEIKGKGLMSHYIQLAGRVAFRKGISHYCGFEDPVGPGMWAGGIVGLKSILGVKKRWEAFRIMNQLQELGYLTWTLDRETKLLTYKITDWVVECSGAPCEEGAVYASTGYGFYCMPRTITQRLVDKGFKFGSSDAFLDLWCHTVYRDYGNAFSFLAPAIQYDKYSSVLTLETLGKRWGWEKTKRDEIARQIIRHTMWNRKTLLKDQYAETDKPVRYSRSPIKLRTQYERVYLTTPALLAQSLDRIYDEDYYIENGVEGGSLLKEPKQGDVEVYPKRYYLNPAFDILKLVHFFSTVKADVELAKKMHVPEIRRILVVNREDLEIARMYPDVNEAKGVSIRAYRSA